MSDTNTADGFTTTTSFNHHHRRHQMQHEINPSDHDSGGSGICSRSSNSRQKTLSPPGMASLIKQDEYIEENSTPTAHHHHHLQHKQQQYNSNNRIAPPTSVSSSISSVVSPHILINDDSNYHQHQNLHQQHQHHEEYLEEHETPSSHGPNSNIYQPELVDIVSSNGVSAGNVGGSSIISLKDDINGGSGGVDDNGNGHRDNRSVVSSVATNIDDSGGGGGGCCHTALADDFSNTGDSEDCVDHIIDQQDVTNINDEMAIMTNGSNKNHHRQSEYKNVLTKNGGGRISTSPLPPPPPIHSYSRTLARNQRSVVVSNGNNNIINSNNSSSHSSNSSSSHISNEADINDGNISPTNWHQPQSQVDYIQQQQQQQQQLHHHHHHHQLQQGREISSTASNIASNTDADTVAIATEMVEMHHQSHGSSGRHTAAEKRIIAPTPPVNAYGMLKHDNEILYITENCIEIGRNSSTSHVHFHVARNSFVSRKHFQVLYDPDTCDFYVLCLSKNGVFVDDTFQRRSPEPMKLPKSCFFRFPSTEIRIIFESFVNSTTSPESYNASNAAQNVSGTSVSNNNALNINSTSNSSIPNNSIGGGGGGGGSSGHNGLANIAAAAKLQYFSEHASASSGSGVNNSGSSGVAQNLQQSQLQHHHTTQHQANNNINQKKSNINSSLENPNLLFSPLKISIPKTEQKSPYPSPTGTISAANSCPTSPRQGFQDYQVYNSYNNNNNNITNSNNNHNNNNNSNNSNGSIQGQELFQTPSTSSYNDTEKPPYSYAQLIVQSISAAPDKQLTLSGIYSFISRHYPYYRKEANKGWQNSIRHNLSLNRYFIKVARSQDEPGKGSFWRIDPNSEAKLIDQSYKKRRQRGSQCFRPSYGMPRSAPVSPSHIDNSRDSSPLHDIVLQSAPGSPGTSYQNHLDNQSSEDLMYGSQNVNQQSSSYNSSISSNQYSSPYHISSVNSQSCAVVSNGNSGSSSGGGGGGNGVGNHQQQVIVSAASSSVNSATNNNNNNSNCSTNGGTSSSNSSVIAIKRHHSSSAAGVQLTNNSSVIGSHHLQQQHQQQKHHSDVYDEVQEYNATGVGGSAIPGIDSGDECEVLLKRPKYDAAAAASAANSTAEVNHQ